jgi:metal-dependent amidase/aminoacylase/carboxypeptidase family protein
LVKEGSFTAASCGITIKLKGRTSHAAEPEKGNNPYFVAQKIIDAVQALTKSKKGFSDHIISTLIYIRLGEISFGVSPSDLEMGITLRAYENDDLDLLSRKTESLIKKHAEAQGVEFSFSYGEVYPTTINNPDCVKMVKEATDSLNYELKEMEVPNNWSEDFAYFTATKKGVQFGFGAGEHQPNLHDPAYNFPDNLIEPAGRLFFEIYKKRLL